MSLSPKIKEKIHCSHIGIQGCLKRACEVVFWPKMNVELADFISECEICNTFQSAHAKEPFIYHGRKLEATCSHVTTLTTCVQSITTQITSKLTECTRERQESTLPLMVFLIHSVATARKFQSFVFCLQLNYISLLPNVTLFMLVFVLEKSLYLSNVLTLRFFSFRGGQKLLETRISRNCSRYFHSIFVSANFQKVLSVHDIWKQTKKQITQLSSFSCRKQVKPRSTFQQASQVFSSTIFN